MKFGRGLLPLLGALLALTGFTASAAEVIPPAPRDHFNDYAGVVRRETARQLDAELTQFERDTSNQLLVAIYPRMQSASSIEDYTVRVAQAWRVGQQDRKNGAVLFIFSQDRTLYVQVGYGLEGVLPDVLCKRIIENEITPRFRAGDFDGGVSAGARALMAATRGEYKGTGRTAADRSTRDSGVGFGGIVVGLFVILLIIRSLTRRNVVYSRNGRSSPWIPWGGGGGWGGGSSGGGGGTFSGGGGSFGGGGAGGKW